ncbi:helix-turn-helix domain-containing protein [Ligilactobacillus saerimneri]|uniref:helix-turn-helix domain-containing protein n=1 Tax=Ligilactobacillus saerimneri TaxID=228229 RepID=UPI0024BB3B97|nr:helix-turn-helix transcriptional regulator [Ligilactobacillus saerimneri]
MISFNLKEVMERRGASIQDVYKLTGVSRNTISLLYNGKSKGIQFETLHKLSVALGVKDFNDFFSVETSFENLKPSAMLLVDFKEPIKIIDLIQGKMGDFGENAVASLVFCDDIEKIYIPVAIEIQGNLIRLYSTWEVNSDVLGDDIYQNEFKMGDIMQGLSKKELEKMLMLSVSKLCKLFDFSNCPINELALNFENNFKEFNFLWSLERLKDIKTIEEYINKKYYVFDEWIPR